MSSLYSQPETLSALSSATNESSSVNTPYDEEGPHGNGPKSRSRLASNVAGGVHVRSPSSATSSRSGVRAYRDSGSPGEGLGSYFPRPPSEASSPGTSQLSRRGTTKALIGRFEALDDAASLGYGLAAADRRGATAARRSPQGEKKDKGRLPIRESFRNLLSVFKRHKPTLKDLAPNPPNARIYDPSPSPKRPADDEAQAHRLQKPHALTLQIPSAARGGTDEKVVCVSPVEGHTGKAGPLLYLSRIADSDLPPVWMNCTAQLHSTHILVMWDTPQGNPSPRLVPFTACTDVRSLAPVDLEPEERALLPADEAWKVFELLFEGRAREKFAAHSLTERAMWVSAVWYLVDLPLAPPAGSTTSGVDSVAAPPGSEILAKPLLQDIKRGIEVLQGRSAADGTNIASIRANVDEALEELRRLPKSLTATKSKDATAVMAKLELVQVELKDHLSALHTALEAIRDSQKQGEGIKGDQDLSRLVELQEKLDKVLQLQQTHHNPENGQTVVPDADNATGATQLGDVWLEAFVKHGTSQIEGVAAGVQQLCRELGPDAANLCTSVNGLLAAVQEDLKHNAEARDMLTTESVIGMIDRQRQDQERMLKALATGADILDGRLPVV
ncbi:hypothetical protein BD309DRAFT_993638 [Dichomitus squalens]|nr:hypothetical protein BD309DRAFT_993638 [Dichomitus squalens]